MHPAERHHNSLYDLREPLNELQALLSFLQKTMVESITPMSELVLTIYLK